MARQTNTPFFDIPDPYEPFRPQVDMEIAVGGVDERQGMLDSLLDKGFWREEALKLIYLRTHLDENTEVHERFLSDYRLHFARWLYEQGLLNEDDTTL